MERAAETHEPTSFALPVPGTSIRERSLRIRKETVRVFLPLILAIVAISTYTYTRDSTFISAENIQNVLSQAAPLGILALGQTVLLIVYWS